MFLQAIKLIFVASTSLRGGFVAIAAGVEGGGGIEVGGGGIRGEETNFASAQLDVSVSSDTLLAAVDVATSSVKTDVDAPPEDYLAEDDYLAEEEESFSMSMSMSMSMSNTEGPDCAALQQMDPSSIEGSDLMLIKEYCDEGLLSSADEVAAAMDAFEMPGNPTVDEQFAVLADEICDRAFNETDEDFAEVQTACSEDPRDDDAVIDAIARLSARHNTEQEDIATFGDICASIEQNREEINEALSVLASRSDEQRRRLGDYDNHQVTSFEVGSDMISFFDCYCDQSNAGNDGCARKTALFAQAVANAITQKMQAIGENGENPADILLKTQSSLQKHTSHLRQPESHDPSEVYSSVERAMSEVQDGKCPTREPQPTATGNMAFCIHAGPFFECAVTLGVDSKSGCIEGSCGAGAGMKLTAAVKYCTPPLNELSLELKVCVNAVSEVLELIGKYIPPVETFMNQQFNVYGGCLRLAYAKYSFQYQRMTVELRHKGYFNGGPFSVEGLGNAWIRFNRNGCAYKDDRTWFEKELIAYNRGTGFMLGSSEIPSSDLVSFLFDQNNKSNVCKQKSGPWALFDVTFAFGVDYIKIPKWQFWKASWETHHLFKQTIRFTSTDNPNPGSASSAINWIVIKNNLGQGLCLDVKWSGTADRTPVWLWGCNYGDSQMWYMDSEGFMRSKLNLNKCLEPENWHAFINTCSGSARQRWELTSDGRIRNKHDNRYLGVYDGGNGVTSGDGVQLQSYIGSHWEWGERQQKWAIFSPSNYRLFRNALNRDLCLDLGGNNIYLWDCHYGNNQKWIMDSDGRIRVKQDDTKCLDPGRNVDLHAQLKLWDCNDTEAQKFELTSAGKLRSKKNGRVIGVTSGCGGVASGRTLEMQDEFTGNNQGTDRCVVQQQWV